MAHGSSNLVSFVSLGHGVDLGRDSLSVAIVLDSHRNRVLVIHIQVSSHFEGLIVGIATFLERSDEGFVEDWLHGVANSVVAPNAILVVSSYVSHQEMRRDETRVGVVLLPIGDVPLVDGLEDDSSRGAVDVRAGIFNNATLGPRDGSLTGLVHSNGDVNDDSLGEGGVEVPLGRGRTHVALQAVASVEELAYVATNVVLENEPATRVLVDKLFDVEDEVVQDDKLAALLDLSFKLVTSHSRLQVRTLHILA